jgi:hypothetical protein
MKSCIFGFLLLCLIVPTRAWSQEDTLSIPDLYGTNTFLNAIIAADTAGTGWQGTAGITAWQNRTRVYVLAKNGYYPCNSETVDTR